MLTYDLHIILKVCSKNEIDNFCQILFRPIWVNFYYTLFWKVYDVWMLKLAEVCNEISVREDNALGQSGGATRVGQRGHAVRVGGRRPWRPPGHRPTQQLFQAEEVGALRCRRPRHQHRPATAPLRQCLLRLGQQLRTRDHRPHAGIGELTTQLICEKKINYYLSEGIFFCHVGKLKVILFHL